jgi:hypothetical protein
VPESHTSSAAVPATTRQVVPPLPPPGTIVEVQAEPSQCSTSAPLVAAQTSSRAAPQMETMFAVVGAATDEKTLPS